MASYPKIPHDRLWLHRHSNKLLGRLLSHFPTCRHKLPFQEWTLFCQYRLVCHFRTCRCILHHCWKSVCQSLLFCYQPIDLRTSPHSLLLSIHSRSWRRQLVGLHKNDHLIRNASRNYCFPLLCVSFQIVKQFVAYRLSGLRIIAASCSYANLVHALLLDFLC